MWSLLRLCVFPSASLKSEHPAPIPVYKVRTASSKHLLQPQDTDFCSAWVSWAHAWIQGSTIACVKGVPLPPATLVLRTTPSPPSKPQAVPCHLCQYLLYRQPTEGHFQCWFPVLPPEGLHLWPPEVFRCHHYLRHPAKSPKVSHQLLEGLLHCWPSKGLPHCCWPPGKPPEGNSL